jgi:hypothetical protein
VNPSRRSRLTALFDLIGASPPEGAGALQFGGTPFAGAVLLERGRICWAARPGIGRRFTDLVSDETNVPRGQLEDAYAVARAHGLPVGSVLINRRLVTSGQLRSVLLRQTAETLLDLADVVDDEPVWVAHGGAGYRPQFSFTLPEVFTRTVATGLAFNVAEAQRELEAIVGTDGIGAGFNVDGTPLPIVVGGVEGYEELCALGDWLSGAVKAMARVASPRFLTAQTSYGDLVLWTAADCVFAARLSKGSGFARVVARLKRKPTLVGA